MTSSDKNHKITPRFPLDLANKLRPKAMIYMATQIWLGIFRLRVAAVIDGSEYIFQQTDALRWNF